MTSGGHEREASDDATRGSASARSHSVPLGGSRWAWERVGCRDGALPEFDLTGVVATARFVAEAVRDGLVAAAHDAADGGIAVAIAEMCCHASTGVQARVPALGGPAPATRSLFAEPPGRVLAAVDRDAFGLLAAAASAAGVECHHIGQFGGSHVQIGRSDAPGFDVDLSAADVAAGWRGALPGAFAGPLEGTAP